MSGLFSYFFKSFGDNSEDDVLADVYANEDSVNYPAEDGNYGRPVANPSPVFSPNPPRPQRPVEKPGTSRVLNLPGVNRYAAEVVVMIPADFNRTKAVCDAVKQGKTVIINIEPIDTATAQRVLDFILGATYALSGSMEAVSEKIFVVTPASIRLNMRLHEETPSFNEMNWQSYNSNRPTFNRKNRMSRPSQSNPTNSFNVPGDWGKSRRAANL